MRPMTVHIEITVPMVHDIESAAADNAIGMITDHMKALGFPWHIDDVQGDDGTEGGAS